LSNTVIIIGAGAAGIFCACNLAAALPANYTIIVLEKSNHLLAKVRISGGGRCNLTHNMDSIATMAKCYPRGSNFVKQTFKQFFTTDTLQWFNSRGVATKAEDDGRMFPTSNNSQSIIDCLLHEAEKYKVKIITQCGVLDIQPTAKNEFNIVTTNNNTYHAKYVVVATGGFPKPEHFNFITTLGHTIAAPVPSLFTFNLDKSSSILQHLQLTSLMGVVAAEAHLKIIGTKLESNGPVLITHWGISGPAVLTLSAFAATYLAEQNYNYTVQINWAKQYNENTALELIRTVRNTLAGKPVNVKNPFGLPNRLWDYLMQCALINSNTLWNNLQAKQQNILAKLITSYTFVAKGKTTYKDEFVTAGGVNLAEVNAATCQSKIVPNLFFAGEVLNVDGKTGGFNFQHAWSSGYVAAQEIIRLVKYE
jgi:predicted Rossmann fold flavoprotein